LMMKKIKSLTNLLHTSSSHPLLKKNKTQGFEEEADDVKC